MIAVCARILIAANIFSAAIIIAAFVPLFTLSGIEGHIFGPMAKTYAYAIAGGLIATFTVTPALSAMLLSERMSEKETFVIRFLHRIYAPVATFALNNRILVLGGIILLVVMAGGAVRTLGLELLPKLEEGNFWIRGTMPNAISLEDANGYVNRMRQVIRTFREAITAVSQNGRPDGGTDATGFFNAEFFVPLNPPTNGPRVSTRKP